jgi:hypothetical protein
VIATSVLFDEKLAVGAATDLVLSSPCTESSFLLASDLCCVLLLALEVGASVAPLNKASALLGARLDVATHLQILERGRQGNAVKSCPGLRAHNVAEVITINGIIAGWMRANDTTDLSDAKVGVGGHRVDMKV